MDFREIDSKVLRRIEKTMKAEWMDPQRMRRVMDCAEGLCEWVIGMVSAAKRWQELEPMVQEVQARKKLEEEVLARAMEEFELRVDR